MLEWSDDNDPFNPLFQMIAEEMLRQAASHSAEMNAKCQANFREAVRKLDAAEDSLAVRKLLTDTLGIGTYEIKEEL